MHLAVAMDIAYYNMCTKLSDAVVVYVTGVILYTLLVGYPPFWESSRPRLFEKIATADYSVRKQIARFDISI